MVPRDGEAFLKSLPPIGRLLGLDVGSKTIGIAITDVERRLANPLQTLERGKFIQDVTTLAAIADENFICGVVVGYPLNMNGSEGPRCQSVRQFVRNLETHVPLPMLLWDERQTSLIAEEQMAESGIKSRYKGEWVDKLAAAAILQTFLKWANP